MNMNKEKYELIDTVFKNNLLKVEETTSELEAINNTVKVISKSMEETSINRFLNKIFIIKNLKTNKFKPVSVALSLENYLLDNEVLKRIIKDFNNNEDNKIVGVSTIFYGIGGSIDVSKLSKEEQLELNSKLGKLDSYMKLKNLKRSSNSTEDFELEDIEEKIEEIQKELSNTFSMGRNSLIIKYNKNSTVSFIKYDTIEDSVGNLCISDKPFSVSHVDYSSAGSNNSIQVSSHEDFFGESDYNFFKN